MDWLNGSGWLLGGTAFASLAIAGWSYLKGLGRQLLGRLVVSFEIDVFGSNALLIYAVRHWRPSPFSAKRYDSCLLHVRPKAREQMVVAEELPRGSKLWWCGWRPIVLQLSEKDQSGMSVNCWYLRGMFTDDDLMTKAADFYNEHVLGDSTEVGDSRYEVNWVFGSAGKPVSAQYENGGIGNYPAKVSGPDVRGNLSNERVRRCRRLLKWRHDEIGPKLVNGGRAIDRLALSAEVSAAVSEFEQWLSLEHWYKSRGIPWRTSWLCYGPPGTGKSSIVQALAEDNGLPIWVFDLATLYNEELHRNWNRMLAQVPCIALMEDLDKVFDGSANVSKGDLTLDCLLNCIDGVSRANGLFLVMTTNRIESLDPALKRPGRADSILEMGPPDERGLRKIGARILPEELDLCESLAAEHVGKSGAEFQRICEREALRLLRAGRHKQNGHSRLKEKICG